VKPIFPGWRTSFCQFTPLLTLADFLMVKRILRKYGYPPDKQEKATQTVLQQAELLCADWAS